MVYKATLHDPASTFWTSILGYLIPPFTFNTYQITSSSPNVLLLSHLQAFEHTLPFAWMGWANMVKGKDEGGDDADDNAAT